MEHADAVGSDGSFISVTSRGIEITSLGLVLDGFIEFTEIRPSPGFGCERTGQEETASERLGTGNGCSGCLLTALHVTEALCGVEFDEVNARIGARRGRELSQSSDGIESIAGMIGEILCVGETQAVVEIVGQEIVESAINLDGSVTVMSELTKAAFDGKLILT